MTFGICHPSPQISIQENTSGILWSFIIVSFFSLLTDKSWWPLCWSAWDRWMINSHRKFLFPSTREAYRPRQLVSEFTMKFFSQSSESTQFENASQVTLKWCERWNVFWSNGWLVAEPDFVILNTLSFTTVHITAQDAWLNVWMMQRV